MADSLIRAIGDRNHAQIADLISNGADPYVAPVPYQAKTWVTPVSWAIKNGHLSMLPHLVGTGLKEVPAGHDKLGRHGEAKWDVITGLADVDRTGIDMAEVISAVKSCMVPGSSALEQSLWTLVDRLIGQGGHVGRNVGLELMDVALSGADVLNHGWGRILNVPMDFDNGGKKLNPLLAYMFWVHEDARVAPVLASALHGGYDPNTNFSGVPLLHFAVIGEGPECVKALIEAGADIRARYVGGAERSKFIFRGNTIVAGMTALDFARDIGADQVSSVIEAAVAKDTIDRVLSAVRAPGAVA